MQGIIDTVNTNIKHRANKKIAMSQVNRTGTLNKTLRVADVSEVLNTKSLKENTLMRQRNSKEIVKCKLLGKRKLETFFNDYSKPIL